MTVINDVIVKNAIKADLMRSKLIPDLKSNPITLSGIPYLMRNVEIFSEELLLNRPNINPMVIKGKININNL